MPDQDLVRRLSDLFMETGHAHHEAFIETGGDDPEWPLWYAERLHETLSKQLEATFTQAELVYLLVLADKEHSLRAPGAAWTHYYARFFVERFL